MFSGAEQQAVFLETIARISTRSWELSSRGADRFGCISRNRIRLNFHLAHYLFLVVMGRAGCWGEAQSGATFGFGSEGWKVHVAVVICTLHICMQWEEPAGKQGVFRIQFWPLEPSGLFYVIKLLRLP